MEYKNDQENARQVFNLKNLERDIILNLSRNFKIPGYDPKKDLKCGSLYNLFDSFLFDIHFLICYLDKIDNQGIADTLMNLMYKKFINESFFYLPQLW